MSPAIKPVASERRLLTTSRPVQNSSRDSFRLSYLNAWVTLLCKEDRSSLGFTNEEFMTWWVLCLLLVNWPCAYLHDPNCLILLYLYLTVNKRWFRLAAHVLVVDYLMRGVASIQPAMCVASFIGILLVTLCGLVLISLVHVYVVNCNKSNKEFVYKCINIVLWWFLGFLSWC